MEFSKTDILVGDDFAFLQTQPLNKNYNKNKI